METERFLQKMAELGDRLCIAFSGGVDSSVVVKLASMTAREVLAVTFHTPLSPHDDTEFAGKAAENMGVQHVIMEINSLEHPSVAFNTRDRCYHCKHMMFSALKEYAVSQGFPVIADGTNADDLREYRPGRKALEELGIRSPLAQWGLTKNGVREIAEDLHILSADRPPSPCLATRFPYDTPLTHERIRMVGEGEALLKKMGFSAYRLRVHGEIARIEVPKSDFERIPAQALTEGLKALGFRYITLDLEGLRSGSMDDPTDLD